MKRLLCAVNRQSCIPFDEHVLCENGFVAMLEIIERQSRIVRRLQFRGRGQRKRLSTERKGKKEKRERKKRKNKKKTIHLVRYFYFFSPRMYVQKKKRRR